MADTRTSETHPIYADFIPQDELGLPGRLGMTFAPGMKAHSFRGFRWDRDLKADLRVLREEFGVDVLVSLMEDFEYDEGYYRMGGLPAFGESVVSAGIESRMFHIVDNETPRPDQDDEYAEFVEDIISDLRDGKVVVAHCRGGIGRTGTVAASVLVGLGYDPEEAIGVVRKARSPRMLEFTSQEDYVREFARGYGGKWSR